MKKISVLLLAATVSGCGGGSSSEPATPPASGTIMGSPFTPADRGALVSAPAPCTVSGLGTRSMAALAMGFSSFSNVCGFVQTGGLCADVASSLVVSVSIVNAPATGTASPVGPGNYAIGTHVDLSGNIVAVGADITKVDAVCAPASVPSVQSGTVNLASVSPRVSGTLDLTFTDASRFSGSFDLPVCAAAVNFCTVVSDSCASRACCTSATSCP